MDLAEMFQFTTGTTAGRTHRVDRNLKNNQDAVTSVKTGLLHLGTVSDGCGSQPHSEYGARYLVNKLPKLIAGRYRPGMTLDQEFFDALYPVLIRHMRVKVRSEFLNPREAFDTHMMATVGGVVMTPEMTTFYGAGDFFIRYNNEVVFWAPEEGNKPLYPALSIAFPGDPRFRFRTLLIPTAELTQFLFATDGGKDLAGICGDDEEYIPGTEDTPVGPISQVWANDAFYTGVPHPKTPTTGPEEVGAWLNTLARDFRMPGPANHGGILPDDTTFFAARRRPKENVSA